MLLHTELFLPSTSLGTCDPTLSGPLPSFQPLLNTFRHSVPPLAHKRRALIPLNGLLLMATYVPLCPAAEAPIPMLWSEYEWEHVHRCAFHLPEIRSPALLCKTPVPSSSDFDVFACVPILLITEESFCCCHTAEGSWQRLVWSLTGHEPAWAWHTWLWQACPFLAFPRPC